MHALATISDQSTMPLWGWQGWALFLLVVLALVSAFQQGREIGRWEARRSMLAHPSVRARHADKRFRRSA